MEDVKELKKKPLHEIINTINEKYQAVKLGIQKSNKTDEVARARHLRNAEEIRQELVDKITREKGSNFDKLNLGDDVVIKDGTVSNNLIPTDMGQDESKVVNQGKQNMYKNIRNQLNDTPEVLNNVVKNTPEVLSDLSKKGPEVLNNISKQMPDILPNKVPNKLLSIGKKIPGLGAVIGLGSALMNQDASAGVPILNEAEELGRGSDIVTDEMRKNINLNNNNDTIPDKDINQLSLYNRLRNILK